MLQWWSRGLFIPVWHLLLNGFVVQMAKLGASECVMLLADTAEHHVARTIDAPADAQCSILYRLPVPLDIKPWLFLGL